MATKYFHISFGITLCPHYQHIFLILLIPTLCSPLKIRPPTSPLSTTPNPLDKTNNGIQLPRIHLLNSTNSGELGMDPTYDMGPVDDPALGDEKIFQNGSVYVIPGSRHYVSFQCEANYPIFWNLAHSNIHPQVYNSLRVLSIRKFDDPWDTSTFTYVTILTMTGGGSLITGNYSCQSAQRHEIRSDVFVFWKSSYGTRLILSRENTTISVTPPDQNQEITLPCLVSDPDAQPKLYKVIVPDDPKPVVKNSMSIKHPTVQPPQAPQKEHLEQLYLNDSIQFSPTKGFTLQNLPDPWGTYKCTLDKNEYQFIKVLRKNVTLSTNAQSNYTFIYDDDSKQVQCCTKLNGRKPPKIFMMVCEHPSTCGLREYISKDLSLLYPWNQGRRRKNCSVLSLRNHHTGVVRCVGDSGFNVFKEFIVPIRVEPVIWNRKRNTTTYFRWEEIDPQEMIQISQPTRRESIYNGWYDAQVETGGTGTDKVDRTIYSKQLIHLGCHTSRYYFASGNYWMVRWKNQTINQLVDEANVDTKNVKRNRAYLYYENRNKHSNLISFKAHSDMESVICFAPVWNSSVWVTRIHYLYVNESMEPLLVDGDTLEIENLTWYANETDKVLTCTAGGVPNPIFHWEKDNATILASSYNYHVFTPNASTLPQHIHTTTTTTEATTTTTTLPTGSDGDDDNGSSGLASDDDNNDNSNDNDTTTTTTSSLPGSVRKKIIPKMSYTSLRISRISYGTQGVFRCVATSFAGRVTKEFHITVLEAKSWTATIFFVVSCVLTALLMFGIIFLLRRLHKDRQEINELSGGTAVNFDKNGAATVTQNTNSTSSGSTSSSNGGFGSGNGGNTGTGRSISNLFASTAAIISAATSTSNSSSSGGGPSSSRGGYTRYNDNDNDNSIPYDNGKMTNNLIDGF